MHRNRLTAGLVLIVLIAATVATVIYVRRIAIQSQVQPPHANASTTLTREEVEQVWEHMKQSASAPPNGSWNWFQGCREEKTLGVEVLVDRKAVYSSSFPICQVQMPKIEHKQKTLVFYLKGGHVYQDEYHTLPTQNIEGNIWQAGGEYDALILGVSFMTKKQVLLNSLHIAEPNKASVTEVDRGIVIRTSPLPSSR